MAHDERGVMREATSASNKPGTENSGWGGMNQGLVDPTRGHSMGKQFGGGMEDLMQTPQKWRANTVLQRTLEGQIAQHFRANNRDIVVERRIDYDVLESPDGGRVIGPAREYNFDVTYLDDGSAVTTIPQSKTSFPNTNDPTVRL